MTTERLKSMGIFTPELGPGWMVFGPELAKRMRANTIAVDTGALEGSESVNSHNGVLYGRDETTHMMTIDTILHFALLSAFAGIETRQEGYRIDLVLRRLVLVLEAARVTLGAGASQIVIVAQLVAVLSFLDAIQCGLRYLERGIQSSRPRAPRRRFRWCRPSRRDRRPWL